MMNDFRNTMEKTIKNIMHEQLFMVRNTYHLNNHQMANALVMDPRSYFDLKTGENECGLVTTILLILKNPDRDALLNELEIQLTNCMEVSDKEEVLSI